MNNVSLVGNLARDPELKYASNGMAFVNCAIAVRRTFKDKQSGEYQSDFIGIKAFGKTAELVANSFHKGSKLGLTGNIQTGRYENQQGQTVYTTDVVINSITFVEPKGVGQAPSTNTTKSNYKADPFTQNGPITIDDSDLPF